MQITLVRTAFGVNLSVSDDGIGMRNGNEKRGIGLRNIHTRLESLGGMFDIPQEAGKGTLVHVEIPIEVVYFDGNLTTVSNDG